MSPEPMGLYLLVAGGIFYTAGVPFNVRDKLTLTLTGTLTRTPTPTPTPTPTLTLTLTLTPTLPLPRTLPRTPNP